MSELRPVQARISANARADVSMPADRWLEKHHAYLQLMIDLAEKGRTAFDVIHNNCLHYLPVAMARLLLVRVICTLHTPPTPWLESAIQTGPCPVVFAAVSRLVQIGGTEPEQDSFLAAAPELITALKETAGEQFRRGGGGIRGAF